MGCYARYGVKFLTLAFGVIAPSVYPLLYIKISLFLVTGLMVYPYNILYRNILPYTIVHSGIKWLGLVKITLVADSYQIGRRIHGCLIHGHMTDGSSIILATYFIQVHPVCVCVFRSPE